MWNNTIPSHYYIQTAFVYSNYIHFMVDIACCAVMAAVIVWTSVLWWQLLSCRHLQCYDGSCCHVDGHLLCCDGSCCCVNMSSALMEAVVMWTSPILWWKLLSCERCYCVNIFCDVMAAVVVWTFSVLRW